MQILKLKQFNKLGTANNYLHTLYSFMDFLDGYNIGIDCLTETLVERYDLYLLNRGLKRNSMSFYMRILRSVYNKAVRQRLVVQTNPFANVYTGVDVTKKRAVQPQILSKISKLDLSNKPALQFARDLFLFSFYVRGMAFVDMAFLKKSSISSNVLYYTRRKTGQRLSVKIEYCMQVIIDRYNVAESEYIFPILKSDIYSKSYQQYRKAVNRYNANLKKLSKYAELDVSLTSYVARHSWATIAQNSNVPISVISAALGHTTEQTTRIYLSAIDNSKIDEANSRIISLVDL
jgi:integrase